ncbi:MAG: murein transglycosylase [Alphaproteobacteria bacterium]|nr:murein transglycosylase [Alphaproteobacteria bacterium]
MSRNLQIAIAALLLIAAAIAAWFILRKPAPPPEPQVAGMRLVPATFADLPDWKTSDARAALSAFRRSCAVIGKKSALSSMGGAGYAGTAGDWRGACAAAPSTSADAQTARRFFETWFVPVAVSSGDTKEGLFTGYYEPELKASRTRHGAYETPLYGLPPDLVMVDLASFAEILKKPDIPKERIAGRVVDHRLVPYPTHAQINAGALKDAPVLVYAEDPVAAFFLHIQGSGRVVLDDGTAIRLAFAGTNGRAYTAIGRTLIQRGELSRETVSLQSIRAWLEAHPKDAQGVMESNESFVFFQEEPMADPSLGANGSEGVPLTAEASLAVDQRMHALGTPVYLVADVPNGDGEEPFHRLLVAQDTGGAIRGAVRGDVYWGAGARAETIAGKMKARGTLFVLLPKPVAAALGSGKTYSP